MNIWAFLALSPLFHLIFRWVAPDYYSRAVEIKRKQREEYIRKREEAKRQRLERKLKGGILEEQREITGPEIQLNEETPVMREDF